MRTAWGTWFRALRPHARKKALAKWGYDTPHAAIEADNMEALRFLLDQQASISEKVHGETALQVAIRKRNFEAIRWIATCGANPQDAGAYLNARDFNGDPPLAVAAQEGDLELASVLLELGARTECRNKAGYSAIMWSAVKGNVPMTRLLLEKGASPNAPSWAWKTFGKSPLTEAVFGGNLDVVKLLVEAGANLYLKDHQGMTALALAERLAAIRSPSKPTASTGTSLSQKFPPSSTGCFCSSLQSNEERDPLRGNDVGDGAAIAIAKYLREKFSAIEEPDENGDTPLLQAVKNNDLETARSLLRQGANAATKDRFGRTPLVCAAMNKNLPMVKLLLENSLEAKQSIDEIDYRGRTALMFAARDGDLEMVKLLVANGANLNIKGNIKRAPYIVVRAKKKKLPSTQYKRSAQIETSKEIGFTALTYAAKKGHTKIVKFLLEQGSSKSSSKLTASTGASLSLSKSGCGAQPHPLSLSKGGDHDRRLALASNDYLGEDSRDHADCTNFSASAISSGVEGGIDGAADVNARDCYNRTTLMQALNGRNSNFEIIKLLIKHGADIHARDLDGSSAIHFASIHGHTPVIAYLLEHGADANDMNNQWFTPLMKLSERGAINSVILLIKHGADVDMMEEFGRTALFFAVKNKKIHIVELLLEHHANPNVMDEYTRETALAIAKKKNYTKIADLLRAYGAKE